jgi:ADP-heptose:LPS heptosyltransferase
MEIKFSMASYRGGDIYVTSVRPLASILYGKLAMTDPNLHSEPNEKFDEEYYLTWNRDVAEAVKAGHWRSGFDHYLTHGRAEGRVPCRPEPALEPRFHVESRNLRNDEKREALLRARSILIRRTAAMGDVLMTTPVLARARHLVGPGVRIDTESSLHTVFAGNPHIDRALRTREPIPEKYELFINLDNAYEKDRSLHAIDAYMLEAFGDTDWYAKDIVLIKRPLPVDVTVDWRRAIALHPGQTSRNRTIPAHIWEELIERIEAANLVPVIFGATREVSLPKKSRAIDLTSKLTIQQTATAIQSSLCLVSADTGLTHVAGSTNTPMVTVYTAIPPRCRMPWRYGQMGWRVTSLVPKLDCVGCYNVDGCNRQDFACVEGEEAVSAESIFNAVMELIRLPDHTGLLEPYMA